MNARRSGFFGANAVAPDLHYRGSIMENYRAHFFVGLRSDELSLSSHKDNEWA